MAYLLLVLTVLFWATNFVLARSLVDILPPFTMASLRWSLAFLLLLPFAYSPLKRDWRLLVKHYKIVLVLSLFGVAMFNSLIYLGVQKTTATNATLLQSAIPILVLLFSVIFYRETLSKKQLVGVFFSCAGVATIISQGQLDTLLALRLNIGDLWILAAVSSWTIYSILLRYKPIEITGLSFLAANILIGNILIYPFAIWELYSASTIDVNVSKDVLFSVLYLAIFPSLLSYLFWNRAVAEIGAPKASLFIHLLPVFGTILAAVFLDEIPRWFHFVGITLVFTGIYLAIVTDVVERLKKAKAK
jgi:drug/metabolite transporter (DMT)-like permease